MAVVLRRVNRKTEEAWAVCGKGGGVIVWRSLSDGEEGVEIFRTRAQARGAKMRGEVVRRVLLVTLPSGGE